MSDQPNPEIQAVIERCAALKPGEGFEVRDLSIDDYHHPLCPGISNSRLKFLARSRLHLSQYLADRVDEDAEDKSTASTRTGTLAHLAILEPNLLELIQVAPEGDARTKEVKDQIAAFKAKCAQMEADTGKPVQIASAKDYQAAIRIRDNGGRHKLLQQLLNHPETVRESSFFYKLSEGVILKGRPDLYNIPLQILADLKTTRDASRNSFRRSIVTYRYDVQAAICIDTVSAVYPRAKFDSVFIAIENSPPHGVCLYSLDDACVDVGRQVVKRDLANLFTPHFGYQDGIESIGLPAYAFDIDARE